MDIIMKGDRVRSHDFGPERNCYVEGVVVGYKDMEGCERYDILVKRDVWRGVEKNPGQLGCRVGQHVFPPLNGTRKTFGGVCDGVELLYNDGSHDHAADCARRSHGTAECTCFVSELPIKGERDA